MYIDDDDKRHNYIEFWQFHNASGTRMVWDVDIICEGENCTMYISHVPIDII
jgi:hypothetical protein